MRLLSLLSNAARKAGDVLRICAIEFTISEGVDVSLECHNPTPKAVKAETKHLEVRREVSDVTFPELWTLSAMFHTDPHTKGDQNPIWAETLL